MFIAARETGTRESPKERPRSFSRFEPHLSKTMRRCTHRHFIPFCFFLCSGNGRIGAHSHKKSGEKYGKHCLLRVRKKLKKGPVTQIAIVNQILCVPYPFSRIHSSFFCKILVGRTAIVIFSILSSLPLNSSDIAKIAKLLSRQQIGRRLPNRLSPDTMTSHRIMNIESLFQQ